MTGGVTVRTCEVPVIVNSCEKHCTGNVAEQTLRFHLVLAGLMRPLSGMLVAGMAPEEDSEPAIGALGLNPETGDVAEDGPKNVKVKVPLFQDWEALSVTCPVTEVF